MKKALFFSVVFLSFFIIQAFSVQDAKSSNSSAISSNHQDKNIDKSQEKTRIIKFATGTIGGNYFRLGQIVSAIVSHPADSLPCGEGGTCGIKDLFVENITTRGSIENLSMLFENKVDIAFAQADVTYGAYTATDVFEGREKFDNLRAVASLYPEPIHIVVRKDSGIKTIFDMKGKRISIGPRDSGTVLGARFVLEAYQLADKDVGAVYLNIREGMQAIELGDIDGLFFSIGVPAPFFVHLLEQSSDYLLLSIDEDKLNHVLNKGIYFSKAVIPYNTYKGIGAVTTVASSALLVTTEAQDDDFIYELTKSIWHEQSKILFEYSPLHKQISVDNSLNGIGIPLHNGAKKFYNEIGKRF